MSNHLERFEWNQRLASFRLFLIAALALLVAGLFYFQIYQGDRFVELASKNRLRIIRLSPQRGSIVDTNGIPLAVDTRTFNVRAYPMDLQEQENIDEIVQLFNRHGIPVTADSLKESVEKQYFAPYRAVSVANNLTMAQIADLVADPDFHATLFPSSVWNRVYPAGALVAHVVGYVGEITQQELQAKRDARYQGGDIVGKNGIEAYYEERLCGDVGEEAVEVNSRGRRLQDIRYTEPHRGEDIRLTLDLAAQRFASELMANSRGVIVALDVEDGSVRVLFSSPTYDPNPLTWRISEKEWNALLTDKDRPMMNRAISGVYPPGSTFKIVTASAALMEHVMSVSTQVHCPGNFVLGPQTFRCWKRSGHGNRSLIGALRDSCDVYFYQAGLQLGVDRLLSWAGRFGVGKPTGIDLLGEVGGNIAGRDWKRRRFKESWFQGDTVNYAIGQGFLLTTPLQIARMYAAVANGGRLVVPRLNALEPARYENLGIPSVQMKLIQQGLIEVVKNGTGRQAGRFGVTVAGKTGTAQNPHGDDHAWFVGYAPAEKPRYVAVALVEGGGAGSSVTGPLVGQMLAYLVKEGVGGRAR